MNEHAERMQQLVAEMTLQEKAALTTGATPWKTVAVERLGLDSIAVADGPHGVRRSVDLDSMIAPALPATAFPVAATLGASWDRELAYEMGQALAEEAIAQGVSILLGPGLNIKRSPLCGRNFEYFSEDPLLSGEMAAALVNGMQSKGVGACIKHYAVNNQETRRNIVDVDVDERSLHEIYLEGFRIAIEQSNPWTVMCAYNSINGAFAAENDYLLTDVLREQWGYEGFVMSDWGAVHDRVEALRAGLELEMPGPSPYRTQQIIDAVNNGDLSIQTLDQAVTRLLRIILKAQETPKDFANPGSFDVDAHHQLARKIAAESIVLLENFEDVLPLTGDETLAVVGLSATQPRYQGGGSSHINPTRVDTPLDLIRERAGYEVPYAVGDPTPEADMGAIAEAVAIAARADVTLLFIGLPQSIESEGYDRDDLLVTPQQRVLIGKVAAVSPKTVLILQSGSAVGMHNWPREIALLQAGLAGQAGAGALVDVLWGDVNPSGRLQETYPLHAEDLPAHLHFPGDGRSVRYGEGLFVGYRALDALRSTPKYAFGSGMSYSTFRYTDVRISQTEFGLDDTLTVEVDLTNVSERAGKEVVQLYILPQNPPVRRPLRELKGFEKVAIEAGQSVTVQFELSARDFSYYSPQDRAWIASAGAFTVEISRQWQYWRTVTLTESTPVERPLTVESTVGEWMAHPAGREMVMPMVQAMSGDNSDTLGMDMVRFFQDIPLPTLMGFQGALLQGADPRDVVRGMLAQVHGAES